MTGVGHLTTNLGSPIEDGVVAIADGAVVYAGPSADAPMQGTSERLECEGRAAIPGFVDAHTHLVFAGDRSGEFARRLAGESYADIAASGGGIMSTVEATRSSSEEALFHLTSERVWRMIRAGTTTIEIKSGYGLDLETELRLLRVARRVGDELPVTVKTTFLGAHTVPPEFAGNRGGYVDLVVSGMIPAVAGKADYCDVFVENGAFEVEEARLIFDAGAEHGMKARVHAEQLGHAGGARLAAEIRAMSADHLDHATREDAVALAEAGVSAVLVPGASYTLRGGHADGPMLINAGCDIALATDCNPGTSYFESMHLVVSLAVVQMGLTVDQAIRAATLGGARSLGYQDRGMLAPGSVGDLVVIDAPTPAHIAYRPASALTWATVRAGVRVA